MPENPSPLPHGTNYVRVFYLSVGCCCDHKEAVLCNSRLGTQLAGGRNEDCWNLGPSPPVGSLHDSAASLKRIARIWLKPLSTGKE
eukprot:169131-Amphidinium_carterae.1